MSRAAAGGPDYSAGRQDTGETLLWRPRRFPGVAFHEKYTDARAGLPGARMGRGSALMHGGLEADPTTIAYSGHQCNP